MTVMSPDHELVSAYAREGCEKAFRALVARHVSLVYATALRQVGDPGIAEEVTQNVFVVLARKAPRLGGIETLAGWLHRTAILEAKARIRAELRRRRREELAAEADIHQREGTSPFAELIPLLDEALLHLREGDRLALVLRFLEERSLQEVGRALGVPEDTARKRVSRALDRLSHFFRQRGFTVASGAGTTALLSSAANAAPAGLAVTAAEAGLAAGGAATGLNLVLYHFMALTKTQTVALCILCAAAPLLWQRQVRASAVHEVSALTMRLATSQQAAEDLERELHRTREALAHAQAQSQVAEGHLAELKAQREGRSLRPAYHWDDSSQLVRVPKTFLDGLPIGAVQDDRGQLTEQMKQALQLTDAEVRQTQAAVDRFLADYHAAQARKMHPVQPTADDLSGRKPEETRVFVMSALGEGLAPLRQEFFEELDVVLGSERAQRFREGLRQWMAMDDEDRGVSSSMAVVNFDRRESYYQPKPGERTMVRRVYSDKNHSSVLFPVNFDEIPPAIRAQLQDWISQAESQSADTGGNGTASSGDN
ncbi:MAG: hypothetical protein C5B50_12705 [Verrucomicrobia bacterium]|nr:MAG: hypothetical protein C5B50_12705 [Verrucomicrobiota bacterium]